MLGALRKLFSSPADPGIEAERVYLRAPQVDDFAAWSEIRGRSRAFLTPWEPTWPRGDLTALAFRQRVRRGRAERRADRGYPFFLFLKDDDLLIGGLTLSNVRRGVTQTATLGYWIGEPHARQGHMTEAVPALLAYAFATLRLHRIEAACLPVNDASKGLLEKCSFRYEGYARKYLRIDGRWQDHLLYARLVDDPDGPEPEAPGIETPETVICAAGDGKRPL